MLIRHRATDCLVTCTEAELVNYPEVEWEYNPSQETLDRIEADRAAALAAMEAEIEAARVAAAAREAAITALLEAGPPSGSIPAGVIVMWSGVVTAIPGGWAICDGTNGTPDLRGKFIRGASGDPGATGGAVTHTHADHAALPHSGATVDAHPAQSHSGAAVSAHSGAAVGDHATLTHSGTDVSAHAGTAVSAHAGCAVAAHTVVSTKQGSSTGNVVTTATHTVTQPSAHTVTQPSNHTVTQPAQHAAQSHSVTQPVAHTVTQPDQHPSLTHTVTQPSQHAAQAHSEAGSEPPYYELAYIMKT
jgi:hypothetical protein